MIVANPLYDVVFKYLMEDMRIARTILSALTQQNISKVEVRPHEYSNIERESLSVFRIDFAATVRKDDGTDELVLIELQKTWVVTETLRFRQYLGRQYSEVRNMYEVEAPGGLGGKHRYGLPMMTIYLVGHCVGDIEEPVLYVRRKGYDRDGNEVTRGLPDPFVDSLTHDAIIVQIPRLHGRVNSRLDKVLSFFDQSRIADKEQTLNHTLSINADDYDGDAEMMRIVNRLLAAAADAEVRHSMNVEDEYFSVIEENETEIRLQKKLIAEQRAQMKEKDAQMKEMDEQLRKSISLLRQAGMSSADIAKSLGTDLSAVERLL